MFTIQNGAYGVGTGGYRRRPRCPTTLREEWSETAALQLGSRAGTGPKPVCVFWDFSGAQRWGPSTDRPSRTARGVGPWQGPSCPLLLYTDLPDTNEASGFPSAASLS